MSLSVATPSPTADLMTSRATRTETSRTAPTPGSKGAVGSRKAGERSATPRTADTSILSVSRLARERTQPRPMPGNTTLLLHSATSMVMSLFCAPQGPVTGSNGLPVATRARPDVQVRMSFGTASWRRVGLDRGRITGRGVCEDISLMISSVKEPGTVDVPISTFGWTCLITSRREGEEDGQSDGSLANGFCPASRSEDVVRRPGLSISL
ncbi:hypothetical protein RRF57_010648 [Xylaria bambusicola]|uniref:Uncharacterized protein n=1 Tax=Xylaria bambusicola TaxID=326684 RepID=A0AAN7Z8P7_9PEZI